MASKPILNRLYWASVKAVAHGDGEVVSSRIIYYRALKGLPDRAVLPYLEGLEARHGKHSYQTDLANPALWNARVLLDDIRDGKTNPPFRA